ncbi:MAG TPA: CHAT domain-containing protein [Anaerolineae bacterium]|nr:CHAT domain-containing protein [Anaerolineae bacterium]
MTAEQTFRRLLTAHTTDPTAPLPLPADAPAVRAVFEQTKTAIMAALDRNDLDGVEQCVALAWAVADQTQEAEHRALAHWCQGLALLNRQAKEALSHLDSARRYYRQAGRAEEEGRVLIGYAGLLGVLGRLEEAESAIQRAMECLRDRPDYRGWPALYINLADIQGRLGRYGEMLSSARQAESLAQQFGLPGDRARALINQAFAALFLGRFALAESSLQAALRQARDCGSAELAGRAALNLARLSIYRGELFAALRFLHQAQDDFTAARIEIDLATTAIEEANLYERLRMPHEAHRAAVQAAQAFDQAGFPTESVEAWWTAMRLALALDKPGQAQRHRQAAQALAERASPLFRALLRGYGAHPLLHHSADQRREALAQAEQAVQELRALGAAYEALDAALIAADLAAALRQPDARSRYRQIAAQARESGLLDLERRACLGLAARSRPTVARQLLRRAADLVAEERQRMPVEELKANLLTGYAALYRRLIQTQLRLRRPGEAAQTLLEAKGSLWADLAAPPPPAPAPDPAWLQAQSELHYWQEERRWADEAGYAARCEARIAQAEAALTDAARRQTQPRSARPLPSWEQVQAALPAGSLLVDLFLGERDLHACLFSPDAPPHWVRLGPIPPLRALVGRLGLLLASLQHIPSAGRRQEAARSQQGAVDALLVRLHDQLIAPLEPWLPVGGTLIVAPDDFLFELPWAALRGKGGYLGQRFSLSLTPSAIVAALRPPAAPPPPAPPLALGYAGHPPLAGVETELAAIEQAAPDVRLRLPGRRADLEWERPPRFLHIAAHGRINRRSPLLSYLELADGPFLLAQALHLGLAGCRWVVLSACQTGTMPERGGAALALAGAFLLAGADAVLASLWPVDDEATGCLMSHFYTARQQGAPLPQALQTAQAAVRRQGYEHPYYWAAFHPLVRAI